MANIMTNIMNNCMTNIMANSMTNAMANIMTKSSHSYVGTIHSLAPSPCSQSLTAPSEVAQWQP